MGKSQPVGSTRVSKNGYLYRKLAEGQWELEQRLLAEKKLERPLRPDEYVRLKPGADKSDPQMSDILIHAHGTSGLRKKIADLEATIKDKQDELTFLKAELHKKENGLVGSQT